MTEAEHAKIRDLLADIRRRGEIRTHFQEGAMAAILHLKVSGISRATFDELMVDRANYYVEGK